MQVLQFMLLVLTLSILWNLPFIDWALRVPRRVARPPLVIKGIRDVEAIHQRLRVLKLHACGPAC